MQIGEAGESGTMKSINHPEITDVHLEQILYALSDTTRLKIVDQLYQSGEQPCKVFDFLASKAALSHHFKVLRENGVIRVRAEGRNRFLSIRLKELDGRFPGLVETIIKCETDGVR